ncbi:MAG: hypothetical protein QOF64_1005, partial [Candidatus Binatota bacterium]|nr:hypothetical protein [Candidatus Binatota bacterium]
MAEQKPVHEILKASAENRQLVTASLYDQAYELKLQNRAGFRSKERQKKIALYRKVIGRGYQAILEIGCGSGDLTYAIVDHAEKIVGTDISAKGVEWARSRKDLWSLSGA